MILFGRMVMKCYEERGLAIWVESRFIAVLFVKSTPKFSRDEGSQANLKKNGYHRISNHPGTLTTWNLVLWWDLCWFVGCQDGTMWFDDIWLMIIVGDISLAGYPTIHWLIISVLCSWFFNGNWGEKIHDINDYNKLTPMSLEMMVSIQGELSPNDLISV